MMISSNMMINKTKVAGSKMIESVECSDAAALRKVFSESDIETKEKIINQLCEQLAEYANRQDCQRQPGQS